jgi:hypothetical protein
MKPTFLWVGHVPRQGVAGGHNFLDAAHPQIGKGWRGGGGTFPLNACEQVVVVFHVVFVGRGVGGGAGQRPVDPLFGDQDTASQLQACTELLLVVHELLHLWFGQGGGKVLVEEEDGGGGGGGGGGWGGGGGGGWW